MKNNLAFEKSVLARPEAYTYQAVRSAGEVAVKRIEELESAIRMITSHATMGTLDYHGQSVNDICVKITWLRNELYNDAKRESERVNGR